jgi:hypothetical protein
MVGSQPCPKYLIGAERQLTVANTLAYYVKSKIIVVKGFIAQVPEVNHTQWVLASDIGKLEKS